MVLIMVQVDTYFLYHICSFVGCEQFALAQDLLRRANVPKRDRVDMKHFIQQIMEFRAVAAISFQFFQD